MGYYGENCGGCHDGGGMYPTYPPFMLFLVLILLLCCSGPQYGPGGGCY